MSTDEAIAAAVRTTCAYRSEPCDDALVQACIDAVRALPSGASFKLKIEAMAVTMDFWRNGSGPRNSVSAGIAGWTAR